MLINKVQVKIPVFFFGYEEKQKERHHRKYLENDSPRTEKYIQVVKSV